jgi:uncharacterized membrane protein
MHEHIAPFVYYLEVHLLYASILCVAAWALTSVPSASATWKYWIWVATSVNFMVPLGGFFNGFGASRVSWATQLARARRHRHRDLPESDCRSRALRSVVIRRGLHVRAAAGAPAP